MQYKYSHTPSIIHLSGETGMKIYKSILENASPKFNPRKAAKIARKKLRKQGYYL